MVSNQTLRQSAPGVSAPLWLPAFAVALAALCLAGGCASHRMAKHDATRAAPTAPASDADNAPPAAEEPMTATDTATTTSEATETPAAPSDAAAPIVNPSAPKRYTVKRGDTLWAIANMYLRDPWLWPEIWYVNPQVENPHLIYPGDVLALAYGADGRPQVRLEEGGAARMHPQLRSLPIDGPIATIPYSAIASFLGRPTVLTKEQVQAAPYVLAFRGEHKIGGSEAEVYVRDLGAQRNQRFSVFHIGEQLKDPDSGRVLGFLGVYTATALVQRPGEITKAVLTDTARETLEGDRLIATDTDVPLNFMPRSPRKNINGAIIAVVDGEELIGQYHVVAISRGTADGVEPGHVLAVNQRGALTRDRHGGRQVGVGMSVGSGFGRGVRLPDERAGTMLVFKSYEHMSYGLIVSAEDTIHVADRVVNP
jgi:LysM repeat protein